MMNMEFESVTARGLRRYARLVERALGLGGGGHYVQLEPVASIYLPLHDRLTRFPDHDVALIWDERHGWAAGVENAIGNDVAILAYLTSDVLPRPPVVAEFVSQVYAGDYPGEPEPHIFRAAGDVDDLAQRLADYAMPTLGRLITTRPAERLDAHR